MSLYAVKSFPNSDAVQTEARLARGCEQHVLHGAGSFQGDRACDVGKRGMDDPQVFGHKDWTRRAREPGWEWERGNRVATRAGDNGLQARHLGQKKRVCGRIEGRHVVEQCIQTRAT